jgi:DNA-binding response OmpR family regulator
VSYSNTPVVNYAPTLVIDTNGAAAEKLVNRLRRSGFTADTAVSCPAAIAAVRARSYASMIFVGDAGHLPDLQCIAQLRRRAHSTWIIMISSTAPHDMRELYLHFGVDALLVAPFSMEDLEFRLWAFSLRSRPP